MPPAKRDVPDTQVVNSHSSYHDRRPRPNRVFKISELTRLVADQIVFANNQREIWWPTSTLGKNITTDAFRMAPIPPTLQSQPTGNVLPRTLALGHEERSVECGKKRSRSNFTPRLTANPRSTTVACNNDRASHPFVKRVYPSGVQGKGRAHCCHSISGKPQLTTQW